MDLITVLTILVIVGICAAIAQVFFELLLDYVPGNLLTTVIVGILGAYLGSLFPNQWPLSLLNISVGSGVQTITVNLLWTIVGSAIVLVLLYILPGGKRRRPRPVGRP